MRALGRRHFLATSVSAAPMTLHVSLHDLKGDTVFATGIEPESWTWHC
jgi:hypothetical protein